MSGNPDVHERRALLALGLLLLAALAAWPSRLSRQGKLAPPAAPEQFDAGIFIHMPPGPLMPTVTPRRSPP